MPKLFGWFNFFNNFVYELIFYLKKRNEYRVNGQNYPYQIAYAPGPNTHAVYYGASEKYLNSNVILLSNQGSGDLYLEAGEYNYPFQAALPANLPSSFEHFLGKFAIQLKEL